MEIHAMAGHLIRRLNQISTGLFLERMAETGLSLTPVQFAALCALRDHPGIDQATVAGLVAYDRATMGKVVDKLVERGFVRRATSSIDRRAKELHLTADGAAFYERALPHVRALQPDILAGLDSSERAELIRLLDKTAMAGNDRSRAPLKLPETGS